MAKMRLLILAALFVVAGASTAAAQEYGTNTRLFGQFILGVAGNVDVEELSYDLDPTIGFGAGADFGLHQYFALGGVFRFLSMSGEDSSSSLSVLDIDPLPRLRYPFEQGEVYLGIPVGLSIYIPEEGDSEVGWNLSFLLGGLYKISEEFALFAELGYLLHFYSDSDSDADLTIGQVGLSIGAAYTN